MRSEFPKIAEYQGTAPREGLKRHSVAVRHRVDGHVGYTSFPFFVSLLCSSYVVHRLSKSFCLVVGFVMIYFDGAGG